jgi:hypothetical protein
LRRSLRPEDGHASWSERAKHFSRIHVHVLEGENQIDAVVDVRQMLAIEALKRDPLAVYIPNRRIRTSLLNVPWRCVQTLGDELSALDKIRGGLAVAAVQMDREPARRIAGLKQKLLKQFSPVLRPCDASGEKQET